MKTRRKPVTQSPAQLPPIVEVLERSLGYGSAADLAELIGVSERTVQRLARSNIVKLVRAGVYDLDVSVRDYIRELKNRPFRIVGLEELRRYRDADDE